MKRLSKVWVASWNDQPIVSGTNRRLTARKTRDIVWHKHNPFVTVDEIEMHQVSLMIGNHIYGEV